MRARDVPSPEQFRPDDIEIQQDPYPYYPILRDRAPVLKSSFGEQPCWILSRHEDITRVLQDPVTFSSRTTPIPNMLFSDPPEHGRLRRIVSHMFGRAAVQGMAPAVERYAEALLEARLAASRCDIVTEYAGPLTVAVIGFVLGISLDEVERLRALTRLQQDFVLSIRLGRPPTEESRLANDGLVRFMADLIRTRNYQEGAVIAKLAEMLAQGELTEEECAQFAVMLLIAGHSTTTNLIANAVYVLTQYPDHLEKIRTDQAFSDSFVEEVLRTRPSFHRNMRITTREVEIGGETIPAGAVLRLLLASANRDPEFFENPEAFDPGQKNRMHISFGFGIHTCLGSWLARLEGVTALRVLAARVATVALDPGKPLTRLSGGTFNEFGFEHLPVVLSLRV